MDTDTSGKLFGINKAMKQWKLGEAEGVYVDVQNNWIKIILEGEPFGSITYGNMSELRLPVKLSTKKRYAYRGIENQFQVHCLEV